MTRVVSALALCLLFTSRAGLAQAPAADQSDVRATRVIHGIVVDAFTDAPLRRARLTASSDGARPRDVSTAVDGTFTLNVPHDGAAIPLRVAKAGYLTADITVPPATRADVITEVRIALVKGAAIAGRAVDATGGAPELIPPVVLERLNADGSTTRVSAPAATAPSLGDPEGRFRFGGLPAGRYVVRVDMRLSPRMRTVPRAVDLAPGQEVDNVDLLFDVGSAEELPRDARQGTSAIRGRVSGMNGEPVAGAAIMARSDGRAWAGRSNASGQFSFEGLPAGSYTILAFRPGYTPWPRPAAGSAPPVAVAASEAVEGVEVQMARTGAITGLVTDEHGEPLLGAEVRVTRASGSEPGTTFRDAVVASGGSAPIFTGKTDERGIFRAPGLSPGSYIVAASAAGATSEAGAGYAALYYPGTTDAAFATPIAVGPAEEVKEIALALRPITVGRVSGTAFTSDGMPASGTVRLRAPDAGAGGFEPRTVALTADGEFTFPAIPIGIYAVELSAAGASGRERALEQVIVAEGDQPPVILRAHPGARASGRLRLEGDARRPILGFTIATRRVEGSFSSGGGSHAFSGPVSSGLEFSLTDIWGPTRIIPTSADDTWYLKSLVINGVDAVDDPFDFGTEGRSFDDVEIVFAANPATVGGRVADERGVPVAGVSVVVFPVDATRWFAGSRWVKSATSRADGTFEITGLPPGAYHAAATVRPDDVSSASVLHELAAGATRVTASPGAGQPAALRLIRR